MADAQYGADGQEVLHSHTHIYVTLTSHVSAIEVHVAGVFLQKATVPELSKKYLTFTETECSLGYS